VPSAFNNNPKIEGGAMRLHPSLSIVIGSLAATILAQPQVVRAQGTEGGIEEVTITAQRRAQNLQEVPVAVTAFTEAELERRQITRTLDLISFVPNMIGHNNTGVGTANSYSIRALNNTESIATFDPPVGTYVDDVFMARQNANNFQFFDVERIEVLRGPQGTLFGRNNTGGAISIVMKKPGTEMGGFVEAGFGEYSRQQARASIDLPISDTVLTKISAFYAKDDGFVKNRVTGQTLNWEDSNGVRGAVRVLFNDKITWDLSADLINSDMSNIVNFVAPGSDQRFNHTRLRTDTPIGAALVSQRLRNVPLGNYTKSGSIISNFSIDLASGATLNLITGYRDLDQQFITDSFDSITGATFAPNNSFELTGQRAGNATPLVNDGQHSQVTQEIKLSGEAMGGSLDYTAGLFYFTDDNDTSFANISLPVTGNPTVTQDRVMKNDTKSYAAYAQFDYHVSDRLTTTVGLRYTDEEKNITFTPNNSPIATKLFPPINTADLVAAGIPTRLKESQLTPRFAFDYKLSDDAMVFASATRGFKAGGWNARANFGRLALAFESEKVWSYEAGARTEWLDGRLRVNLNAFFMDVKDFQLPAGYADPLTNIINYLTRNFADMENYGLEAEISWAATDNINVFWGGGTQKAKYVNVDPSVTAQAANCKARIAANQSTTNICNVSVITPLGDIAEPVRAPEFTSTLGINGTFPIGANLKLQPSVNWAYVAANWAATANTPIGRQQARSTLNAGLTLRPADGKWSLTADCTNCTNEAYVVSFLVYPYLNEPRRWMVRARYEF
jgi:iron complex outermembrane receptor protein